MRKYTAADREALRVHPSIQRWLRPYPSGTQYQYLRTMVCLLDFAALEISVEDPTSFLAWAKKTEGLDVEDFIEKFSETTTRSQKIQSVAEVRSFLKANGKVDLPAPRMRLLPPKEWHRRYRREEILALLSYLDSPVQKLYVYSAKDSGLRPFHVLQILYRHIRDDLRAEREYVYINFPPPFYEGRKMAGRTFLGPETVRLLKECISQGLVTVEDDSPIFAFSYSAISAALKLARRKAKLDRTIQPSNGFRKFFEDALDRSGLDTHKKLMIEGHAGGVRNKHYTDRDVDELRQLYKQSYRHLDLSGRVEHDTNIAELQRQLNESRSHIDSLKSEITGYRDLEARYKQVEANQESVVEQVSTQIRAEVKQQFRLLWADPAIQAEQRRKIEHLLREAVNDARALNGKERAYK